MAKLSQRVRQARTPKYKTRGYTRCRRCGRARAVYRKFGVCRICFRELANQGIAAEDIPRAFSAFFTTKRDGLGLGLPISQGIVQDFGGQLTYQAHPGGGAEFTIELRRAP